MQFPESVKKAIQAYEKEKQKSAEQSQAVADREQQLEADHQAAKAKLDAATDKALEKPTDANRKVETEARKKVAELELEMSGNRHRRQRASAKGNAKQRELAINAIREARAYAYDRFQKENEAKLKAIEEAKITYLKSLADYGSFKRDLMELVHETARVTNPNLLQQAGNLPHFPEVAWNYRADIDSDGNLYTVTESDMNRALRHGDIERKSSM